jgi:hypothetical protein
MNVVSHTGILGQINNAINNATSYIKHIEITGAEMAELLADPMVKTYQGKYYGSEEIPVITQMDKVKEGELPRWLFYRGVRIIKV